jgi:hypothetical protein
MIFTYFLVVGAGINVMMTILPDLVLMFFAGHVLKCGVTLKELVRPCQSLGAFAAQEPITVNVALMVDSDVKLTSIPDH